jgi:hypothetical protein
VATDAGASRWWRRGRDAAQTGARAAGGDAATAFLELDTIQRETALQVEAYAALERGAASQRIVRAWAAHDARANQSAQAYLAVVERFDVALDLSEVDAQAAEHAYRRVEYDMKTVRTAIKKFADETAGPFARVTDALGRLGAAGRLGDAALAEARTAVERAETAGLRTYEAAEVLEQAQAARAVVAAGAGVHGLRETVAAADAVLAGANRARQLAETLPQQREQVRRDLVAVRTRIDALANRLETLPATLSTLRRRFVATSFADVENRPRQAREQLDIAREQLSAATRFAADAEQRWPQARVAIADARAALDAGTDHARAVTDRLAALEAVVRDPQTPVRQTRFTVREAQRLFVYRGAKADPRLATQLDSLVSRIDAAERALQAPHPDYWRVLSDLQRVRDETAGVVTRLRGG